MPDHPASTIEFKDWDRLARKLSFQFLRGVQRRGVTISIDEAYSEVCLRWVHARNGFNPALGFAFSTYFTSAVINHIKPYAQAQREQRMSDQALRLDDLVASGQGIDDRRPLHEVMADHGARGPDHGSYFDGDFARIGRRTPLVARLLTLMREAPEELLRELTAAQAQRDYARRLGVNTRDLSVPSALTPTVLGHIFRLNWKQQLQLKQEMEEMYEHIK